MTCRSARVSPSCDRNSTRALGPATVQQSVRQYLIEAPELFAVHSCSLGLGFVNSQSEKFMTCRSARVSPSCDRNSTRTLGPATVQQSVRQYLIEAPELF